ncbi:4'-phosphopantetheinyl transferase superfamily protein, partial [uncultured Ruminococcus sp.]
GVDCESIRPLRPGVLHRSFSPDESRFVLESPVPDESFFRLWTLKESFVKALGIGISYPLHTAVFALDGETVTAHPDGWQFRQFRLESGHVVSCCVSPGDTLPAFPEHIAI